MHDENRPTHKRSQRERGQALVEFAMVVPIFLILVFGIVDFGMGLRAWISITNSAREGARYGAVGAACDAIEARVVDTSADLLTVNDVTVANCQGDPGTDVGVTVDYDYSFITPLGDLLTLFSGGSFPQTLNMTSSSHMRIE